MTDYTIKTPQQLGAVLRGYRTQMAVTQQQVGAKTGLTQPNISQIEADPGRSLMARVFKVLGALDLELVVRQRKQTRPSSSEW